MKRSMLLQEELGKWRERSTAPHFLTAAAAVQNLAQTLPQLIHHKVGSWEAGISWHLDGPHHVTAVKHSPSY